LKIIKRHFSEAFIHFFNLNIACTFSFSSQKKGQPHYAFVIGGWDNSSTSKPLLLWKLYATSGWSHHSPLISARNDNFIHRFKEVKVVPSD
jgi:hypothetical protein